MTMLAMCRDCTCCTYGSCTRDGRYTGYCRPTCPCPTPLASDYYDDDEDFGPLWDDDDE